MNLQKGYSLWGNWRVGNIPPLELLVSAPHPLNGNNNFFEEGTFSPFLYVHCLERTYFQQFSIEILICVMNILFLWNLNILHIIYYLSPNAFSYIVFKHFLHTVWVSLSGYLIKSFIFKRLCNLRLEKVKLSYCV